MYADIDRQICCGSWCGSYAEDMMEELLTRAGPRPAGGEGIKKAREILKRELEGIGAGNITEEAVNVPLWIPGSPEVRTMWGQGGVMPSVQCIGSSAGSLAAHIFDAGEGNRETIGKNRDRIEGSVALLCGHIISGGKFIPLSVRLRWLHEAGAAAVILKTVNDVGSPAVEYISITDPLPIPVLSVSKEDGAVLEKAAGDHSKKVFVHTDGYSKETECANLYADFGPDGCGTVILGAHLDSFHNVPGAFDNLTGVLTILMAAKLLAPYRGIFKRKLRVIFYTGEELMMLGSREYTWKHSNELRDIDFVVNMDCVYTATAHGTAVMLSPPLRDYIADIFEKMGIKMDVRSMFCMSSDYLPFIMDGIPALRPADFENSFPTWSHTEKDSQDRVYPDWMQHNAMIYSRMLARVLTDKDMPGFGRMTRKEVRAVIEGEDAIDIIRSTGCDI